MLQALNDNVLIRVQEEGEVRSPMGLLLPNMNTSLACKRGTVTSVGPAADEKLLGRSVWFALFQAMEIRDESAVYHVTQAKNLLAGEA